MDVLLDLGNFLADWREDDETAVEIYRRAMDQDRRDEARYQRQAADRGDVEAARILDTLAG